MPKVTGVVGVIGIVVVDHAVEEGGGRQRLLVSGHHHLAVDSAHERKAVATAGVAASG